MNKTIPHSQLSDYLLWLCRRRRRFRIRNHSMAPTLQPGQTILFNPYAYRQQLPQPGDVVIAHHPHQSNFKIIKRVVAEENGRIYLQGDNPQASQDSRSFGPLPTTLILGRVTALFG